MVFLEWNTMLSIGKAIIKEDEQIMVIVDFGYLVTFILYFYL